MAKFVALAASGIALGAGIALVALGFLLLYKATGVVNFAHGSLVTLGAYLAFGFVTDWETPTIVGYLLALGLMFIVGVFLERSVFAPLRGRSLMTIVIATLAASLVIQSAIALWKGGTPRHVPTPVGNRTFSLAGANILYQQVLLVVVVAVIVVAMLWVFHRTAFGRQVRALASDPEAAQLSGVPVGRVSRIAFGVSAVMAGLGGLLIAPLSPVDPNFGFPIMLYGFAAATIGGFGSIGGVVVGSLGIGLAQQLLGGYVFTDYATTLPFVIMFVVIVIWPQGLFPDLTRTRL